MASLRGELADALTAREQARAELAGARERIAELEARLRQNPRNSLHGSELDDDFLDRHAGVDDADVTGSRMALPRRLCGLTSGGTAVRRPHADVPVLRALRSEGTTVVAA